MKSSSEKPEMPQDSLESAGLTPRHGAGNPRAITQISAKDAARFWSKVTKNPSGCWEWVAGASTKGYGRFKMNGRLYGANRIAYTLKHGPLTNPKLYICHKCDNPKCVNPSHLWAGTCSQNMTDCASKDRLAVQKRTNK